MRTKAILTPFFRQDCKITSGVKKLRLDGGSSE